MGEQQDMSALQNELNRRLDYASQLMSELEPANGNLALAKATYKSLIAKIKAFENGLDSESEVAIKIVNLGDSKLMAITNIDYVEPNIICFKGIADSHDIEFMVHISQLSIILMSVPKENKSQPARKIGFSGV